ncbi:MAG: DUF2256 domain-containing protein [Roseovarius sp.]
MRVFLSAEIAGREVAMKHRKKGDLPSKTCATCGLAFSWRKKWERDWENVRHCSEKCRRNRGAGQSSKGHPHPSAASKPTGR